MEGGAGRGRVMSEENGGLDGELAEWTGVEAGQCQIDSQSFYFGREPRGT